VVLTGKPDAISQAASTLRNSALTPTQADLLSIQMVSTLGWDQGLGLMARFQSISESVQEQSGRLLALGEQLGLKGTIYMDEHDAHLWQRLREIMDNPVTDSAITCKIGVSPSASVEVLSQAGMGLIHLSSGLGWWQLEDENQVLKMRDRCESHKGFLSILTAPKTVKQAIDVWGYTGNSLQVMRQIKKQFDSKNIFSPGRFVGGI
jgi:glycolate oxidase FAD binding subunit